MLDCRAQWPEESKTKTLAFAELYVAVNNYVIVFKA